MDTIITSKETSDEMANYESPNNVYIQFLSFCSQALSKENPKFLELIKAKYETCDHEFRCSERMVNLLKETQGNMEKEPSRIFVHLKDLITELKAFGFPKNVKKRKKEKIQAPSCLDVSVDGIGPAQKIPKLLECSVSLEKTDLTSVLKVNTAASFDRRRDQSCLIGFGNIDSAEEISQLKQSDADQNSLNSQALLFENGDPCCEDISTENSLKDRTTCTNSLSTDRCSNVENCLKNSSLQKKSTTIHDIGFSQSQNIEKIVPFAVEDPSCAVKDKAKSNVYGKVELTHFDKNDLLSSKDIQVLEDSKQTSQMIASETICETICNTQRMATNEYGHLEKSLLTTNTLQEVVLKIADMGDSSADAQLPEERVVEKSTLVSLKTSEDALTSHDSVLLDAISIGEEAPVTSLDPDCVVGTTLNGGVDAASPKITITSNEQQPETSVEHSTLKKDVTEDMLGKLGTHDNQNADKTKEHKRANLTSVLPNSEKPETQSKFAMKPGPSWKADEEEGASADEFQESEQDEKLKVKPNRRHVRKLENLLESLRNEIEKCQKRELSIEDLEDETSPYIYEDKLKKKFVAAWKKLCEITSRSVSTGRPTERTIKFSGTRFKEINRRLERFLNKKKVFPDFFDVKNIINLTNKKYKMKLSAMMINDIAREAFVDIGEMLQNRRHQDFIATFGNRQTDTLRAGVDPYMTDPELRRKLDSNRKLARNNLDEVIAKYTRLQNERHYDDDEEDDDDKDEEEENDINEGDGKHTDDKDKTNSLHKGTRKANEMDESVSLYSSDGDAGEPLPGLPENLTTVASGSPNKRPPEGQRITLKKAKPKYDPLQRQLCENPYLAGSDGARKPDSPLPEDAHIHSFVKALGLNPSVQSSDNPSRSSQGSVIVIDESPTPTRSGRGFLLRNLGSSSDVDGQFDDATNHGADPEPNLGNAVGMTLLKKPNIKFTARKTLPPEIKPLRVYADNEDNDVMISYEEIAKENLEDSEDQSSDAGSENNDLVLEDEDDDILVIDSSESENGSESSRGGSPVSIISLGSSLEDEEETFENDIDLVNKMFKIKKEVVSPQKLTSDPPKDEQDELKEKSLDQFKLKSFEEFSKYGHSRESMKSTHCNTNTHLSQVLDLANSSGVPGSHNQKELLRKLSRRNGTDFLDLASCEAASAAEKHVKGDLNRGKSSLKIKSGEVQSEIIPDLDNDCIMIGDAIDETLGEKRGQAHQDSILSDQADHVFPSDNDSKTESEISPEKAAEQVGIDSILITDVVTSQEGTDSILITDVVTSKERIDSILITDVVTSQEGTDSILITDVVTRQEGADSILITDVVTSQEGKKEIGNKLNCASKELAHSEDVITGDTQRRADGNVVSSTLGYEALECTENLEVAIEVDECFIGASEMGLPLAAENDTYLLHQDKGKIFQGLLNNQTTCVRSKGQRKVDFIKKQELPAVSKGHTVRSKAFSSPCTEDVSVIVIDENSQDMSISPAENQSQLTNTFPNKSRQNPKDTEKHYQNFLPTTTSSFKKKRCPEVMSRLDHTEVPRLNRVSGLKSDPKYSSSSDSTREQRAGVKSRESGISTKGKDLNLNRADKGPVIEIDCSDDEEARSDMCASINTAISDDAGGFIRNDIPNVEVHTKSGAGSQSLSGKELDSVPTIEIDSASAAEEVTCPSTVADKTKTSQTSQGLDRVEIHEEESGKAQSREALIIGDVSVQVREIPSEGDADVGQTSMQSHLDDPPKTPDCIHNLRESVLPNIDAGLESEVSTSPSDLTKGQGEQDDQQGIALTICSVVSLNEDLVVSESSPTDKTNDINQSPAGCSHKGKVEEVKLVGTESMSSTLVEGPKGHSLADPDASKPNCAGDLSDTEDVVLVEETSDRGEGASSVNKGENPNMITCSKEIEEISLLDDTCSSEKEVQGKTISNVDATSVPEAQDSFQNLEAQQDISSKTGGQEVILTGVQEVSLTSLNTAENVPMSDVDTLGQTKSDEAAPSDAENNDQDNDEIEEDEDAFKSIFRICDKMLRNDKPAVEEKQLSSESPVSVADSVTENDSCKLDKHSNSLCNNVDTALDVNSADHSSVDEKPAETSNGDRGEKDTDRSTSQELNGSECPSVAAGSNLTKGDRLKDGEGNENSCHTVPVDGVTTEVAARVDDDSVNETKEGETDKHGGREKRKRSASTDDCEAEVEIIEELSSAKGKRLCARSKEDDRKLVDQLLEDMVLQTTHLSPTVSSTESVSKLISSKTDDKTLASGSPKNSQETEENCENIEEEVPVLELECDIVEDGLSPSTSANTVEISQTEVSPVAMNRNKKKRERESAEIIAKPEGGQDENSTRDQALQPAFKKPKPGINFIDEIISTIFKEIPPKGKSRQQTVPQADAEDDVVLVEAEFEPKTVVKQKSTVRQNIGNASFHPISSSTPKIFRSNPLYRNSQGQPFSSRVRPSVAGLSPFRPTQGNGNTASRPIPQKSSAFPPHIPLQSHRFSSHNTLQHTQSSHHKLPSLKPRVPIPTVQPQPAVVLNSQFRPRNSRPHMISSSFKPVGGERRVIHQARHIRNTSAGFPPHSSARVGSINPRAQPGTSFSPHSPGSAQRRKVTKLPTPRNIDGAQIVLDESDTDDLSGGGQVEMAPSVPRILSVTSLKADSKYVPHREDAKKQLLNSRGSKDSMKKRPGDVIVLSDSE